MKPKTQSFELVVDGAPYSVKATPFLFNDETRFRVSYNGSPVHIFVLDTELGRLRSIDEEGIEVPDNVEHAIADRLQHMMMESIYA